MSLIKISSGTKVKFEFEGKVKLTNVTSSEGGGGNEAQNALQFEGQNLQYNGETLTFTEN